MGALAITAKADSLPGKVGHALSGAEAWQTLLPGFLRWFALFFGVIGVANALMIQSELAHQRQLQEAAAINRIDLATRDVSRVFRTVLADLRFLAQSSAVKGFAAARPETRATLGEDFRRFAQEKRWYDQVRLQRAGSSRPECCFSTWTISKRSTIPWATRSVTTWWSRRCFVGMTTSWGRFRRKSSSRWPSKAT